MSEMHSKAIKEHKLQVGEIENEKVFLQEQIIKERNKALKIRQKLQKATEKYDQMYQIAQSFLKTSNDKAKIKELLQILDETDQERQLLAIEAEKQKQKLEEQSECVPNQVQQ